jgi:hypothetical protein
MEGDYYNVFDILKEKRVMAKKAKKKAEAKVEVQEVVAEQSAPRKVRIDRRPYIPYVTSHLELGDMDRASILKEILEQFPTVSKGGAQTFLCDMLNPRYTYYKGRVVIKLPDGKVVFQDKLQVEPVTEEPVPTETEVNEQTAE